MYGDTAIKARQDLHLVIHLKKMTSEDLQQVNRLVGNSDLRKILDVEIPVVTLPIGSGRNLAVLVEAAAKHHILLRKGYNAPEMFINRQQDFIHQQSIHRQNPGEK
jgi:HPr kinase/phosphorylase